MAERFNNRPGSSKVRELHLTSSGNRVNATAESRPTQTSHPAMTLIPWRDIWASLTVARMRGNGQMVEVFYETLFKDAIFDDDGAWSLDVKRRN